MKINTSKTAFQSFSLAHKTIHPRLRYKGTALSQTNEFRYLGVTFDNNLNWENHVDNITSRVSKRISTLKRLVRSKWGCAQSTLSIFWGFKARFYTDMLFFQVCQFLCLLLCKWNTHLYLMRHSSTITCATAFQAEKYISH